MTGCDSYLTFSETFGNGCTNVITFNPTITCDKLIVGTIFNSSQQLSSSQYTLEVVSDNVGSYVISTNNSEITFNTAGPKIIRINPTTGCTSYKDFNIEIPCVVDFEVEKICDNGTIKYKINNLSSTYGSATISIAYFYKDNSSASNPFIENNDLSLNNGISLPAGNYIFKVVYTYGSTTCEKVSQIYTVAPIPEPTFNTPVSICENGDILLNSVLNATQLASYSWLSFTWSYGGNTIVHPYTAAIPFSFNAGELPVPNPNNLTLTLTDGSG
jgi:hypothetical protein